MGSLLAGAFAPWLTYGSSGTYIAYTGYGAAGKTTAAGITLPSAALIPDICKAVAFVAASDSSITWSAQAANVFYLGVVVQVLAAATIFFFILFNACTCLCQCLSPCCRSSKFSLLLALIKLALAFIGVIALGTQMNSLAAAVKIMAASSTDPTVLASGISTGSVPTNAGTLLGFTLMAGEPTTSLGYEGKAFGSLGVACLGISAALHVLLALKCGGEKHHPQPQQVEAAK